MIEQQPRNGEKVGYKRERSKGKPWTLDRPKILLSTIQIPSGIHSTPFQQMILSHFRRKEAANRSLTGITLSLSLLYPKAERGGGGETQLAKDL